ncbi:4Fe-4S dicluster domain-containing protein [Bernardetia sp.]|uniref:4Fe-4S dicluster domain-containing protein n=1 Tax=Bernardetia sp. TaxID=1937974 RepID=UPI0025BC66C0|nr:4Fe-4S dicluster domain-containing protein [Bernardetia sp.]
MDDKNKNTYWKDLKEATQTTKKGLGLTWEHFQKSIRSLAKTEKNNSGSANAAQNQSFDKDDISNFGVVTNRYPHEMMPIPDNGRYKLHNEIEDCIVCNKCLEVCPVNCIEIDAIRGTEQVGRASDGSPIRFYAAKFDIDMAKCCFCGLCTVVCPTECLTMTKEFDFSETDIANMNYKFGNLTEEEAKEKQKEWDDFQAEKATKKTVEKTATLPKIKKPISSKEVDTTKTDKKPIVKIKPVIKIKKGVPKAKEDTTQKKPIKIKLPTPKTNENAESKEAIKKPIKIKLPTPKTNENTESKETIKKPIKIKKIVPKTKEDTAQKKPIKIKLPTPKTNENAESKEAIKKPIKIKKITSKNSNQEKPKTVKPIKIKLPQKKTPPDKTED